MSIRVLVVDDSATMRRLISATLRADPMIEVVGEAADPNEARNAIKQLHPDVLTLDIEMPNMNGLDFLEKIMRLRPMPVIMVSTLTQKGAEINLRALEIGAFDCVAKPTSQNFDGFNALVEKVKAASRSRRRAFVKTPAAVFPADNFMPNGWVVAIGSSTGGVEALVKILSNFPVNCPPTLVSQHMPANFIKSFAERLNRLCAPQVAQATEGALIKPGVIYIAPGEAHLEIKNHPEPCCQLNHGGLVNGHRPSVDVMFSAVARQFKARSIGVILTGMGRDGAAGLLEMRQAGAETIGQDEDSCVVYGMPKVAFEMGAVAQQVSLGRISAQILQLAQTTRRGAAA